MFDAQTLQCTDNAATTVFSPWFPRGGDYGIFTLELVSISSNSANLSLAVQLVNKNSSETGNGDNIGSAITRTGSNGAGRSQGDITAGFEELVRYKFTLQLSSGSGTNWAVFRMLAPVWYDKV